MINWKNIFGKSKKDNTLGDVVLGEKLPWPEYQKTGDYSIVKLNSDSIDIIISLTNLSDVEENAIADGEVEVFLISSGLVPFIVLKFGNVFKTDLSVNLMKMAEPYRDGWLKSPINLVRIYLLEGNNAKLKALRMNDCPWMSGIKKVCEAQKYVGVHEVDQHIQETYAQYSTEKLMAIARQKNSVFKIPAVSVSM